MFEPAWDRHCAEFVIAHIQIATGRDIWNELGGCPRSWREAADLYNRMGVRSLKEAVSKVLGRPVDVRLARRGDICLRGWSLGICRGDLVEYPNIILPLAQAETAWRL